MLSLLTIDLLANCKIHSPEYQNIAFFPFFKEEGGFGQVCVASYGAHLAPKLRDRYSSGLVTVPLQAPESLPRK